MTADIGFLKNLNFYMYDKQKLATERERAEGSWTRICWKALTILCQISVLET